MKIMEKAKRFFTLNAANHEGFTLVELIVVIAILAILAGVAVPAYSGYIKRAEKAGDLTLLGAINQAFAAAAMANGDDVNTLTGAYIGLNDDKTVDLTSVSPEAYAAAFAMFYAGNEATAFKVIPSIYFDAEEHVFVEGTQAYADAFNAIMNNPEYAGMLSAVQASKFAEIGADALLGQVTDVAGLAAKMIMNGGTLSTMVMDEEYLTTLVDILDYDGTWEDLQAEMMDMAQTNPDAAAQFMANSTILNVAATMNGMTSEEELEMKNTVANFDFTDLSKTMADDPEKGLAQAALLYGMYTAFNPDDAAGIATNGDVNTLLALENKTNDSGMTFAEYLADINNPNSQAYKDYVGYKGALGVIDGAVSSDSDVANQVMNKGYNDGELSALLTQALKK